MQKVINELSPELNQNLLRLGVSRRFSAGQQIFAENEEATFLPIVLEGSVKMVRYPASGKEVIIGVFREGDVFAIPPAIDGDPLPATAVAMGDVQLLLLARRNFLELMKESAEFSEVILSRMCGILRNRAKTVQILSTPSAEHRIGRTLLQLAEPESKFDRPIEIRLRRRDIAEMSGLTTETTIRTIGHLADKGLVKIIRRKIVIEDVEALRSFLE
jgi:CRP/FNR family transcriptional regulator